VLVCTPGQTAAFVEIYQSPEREINTTVIAPGKHLFQVQTSLTTKCVQTVKDCSCIVISFLTIAIRRHKIKNNKKRLACQKKTTAYIQGSGESLLLLFVLL